MTKYFLVKEKFRNFHSVGNLLSHFWFLSTSIYFVKSSDELFLDFTKNYLHGTIFIWVERKILVFHMMPRVNFMTFLVIHFIFLLSIDFTKFAFFHENFMLALSISRNFYPKNSFVLSYTVHLLVLMICIFIFCFFIPYSFSTFSDFCKNFPKNLNLKRFWRPKNVHHNTITPNSCG